MAQSESESSSSQDNRDMLSSLPDPVLHIIMSFIPTMQAVQLCVLSKRWKTLWTTLPVLNFCFCELGNNQRNRHSTLNQVERLAECFGMVLLLRETTSQLHTFTLDCGSEYSEDVRTGDVLRTSIRTWIRYAIKCNLRVLTFIWMGENILLPSEVFTCLSLEYVTLGRISTPEVINLPSLKQIHLKYSLVDQDFMSKLLNGCPLLEDLHVEGGSLEFSELTSHHLKHLKITSHNCHRGVADKLSEMIINAPNLLSFHFEICSFVMCSFSQRGIILTMPSLHEACIKFICFDIDELGPAFPMTKSNILCGLFNVHHLELNGYSACWEDEIANCRTFSKLTCLSVGSCMNFHQFNLFSSLLEHCPNLKKFSLGPDYEFCGEQIDDKVAPFKCEQLETVEVKFYSGDTKFHWVVKCLEKAVAELPNCLIIKTSIARPLHRLNF